MESCPSLHEDLKKVDWIAFKCKRDEKYAQNLYAALCNNIFCKSYREWFCSWRQSGAIIAEIVGQGSYLNWYCSGMAGKEGFVEEGQITSEISSDITNLGWYLK